MSNTQHAREPAPIRGDHGIGLCSACVQQYIGGERTDQPEYAISYVVVPGAGVALPGCYDHIKQLIKGGLGLILPNGAARGRG